MIAMAPSKKIHGNGSGIRYKQLKTSDEEHEIHGSNHPIHPNYESPQFSTASPYIGRRKRDPRPQTSPIKIMSLVGLKNLFFSQTLTPIPRKSVRDYGRRNASTSSNFSGPFHWSQGSRAPLLLSTDLSGRLLTSQSADIEQTTSNESDCADLESQSTDSKNEKASQKKAFRVDARIISDATIGLSDGLTVPFALTAGLSALGNTKVVVYGGFAELIAGAISMGLGGYLGAKSEA
jgi:hypothetical protein